MDEVRVRYRHRRWEISVGGLTRPMVDWFYCRERAIRFARQRALEVGASRVVVERVDYSFETIDVGPAEASYGHRPTARSA